MSEQIANTADAEAKNDEVIVEKPEENLCAHLDRAEHLKIEIKNLPKFYGIGEFKKFIIENIQLNPKKIKIPRRNSPNVFLFFHIEEDRVKAVKLISELKWKGKQLEATYAEASADRKRKENIENSNDRKRQKTDDLPLNLPVEEKVKWSVLPLADVDYKKQLEMKQDSVKEVLRRLANDLGCNKELKKYMENQKEKYAGLPCELEDIRHSGQIDGYRNKCEFSIGIDPENKLLTVGFRIGSYLDGGVGVGPVEHMKHIPDSMKVAVRVFQEFVRSSDLQIFNPDNKTGHFKQLSLRSAPDQLMAIVGIHPQDLENQKITELKEKLVQFFTEGPGKDAKVTSLYYEKMVKKHPSDARIPADFLWGETHIFETIMGLKFRISPEAFFQINTSAAEILCQAAIELAEPRENSSMLDICCGTGTIGLCFAKHCAQILGVFTPHEIVDAKENAAINNVTNYEFFTGKAQDILKSVCDKAENEDVFAVLDPPRAGLHQKAIHQLRELKKINRLVYISCNPKLASKNFVDLCRPKSKILPGEFFVPVKAVAVDLFPHTNHCELIISFKRWELVKKELGKDH